ncbi:Extracellular xylan exo-alpha-(1-_2)-glucuronosidase precursor [Lacunisphaera limnophila]|uniref:Xylan alpha-1,2-glucuronidase n=1 Tax=Lacunisphaera limnophila TaxID=1838286 RepID=A0A1D8ARQ5_9BACT|nr:alpha-glucuronidase family glycosyl hydrolase [Lacunisphaera limnophila]AOS43573.1 Extracellular xylan exo-alpha-(1->2)-glucuronosidase precursor [Lacunisphaera limnophila]
MKSLGLFFLLTSSFLLSSALRADDGYRLWLRYDPIADASLRTAYAGAFSEIVIPENARPPVTSARDELVTGLRGLLGVDLPVVTKATRDHALILGTPRDPWIASVISEADLRTASVEGYIVRRVAHEGGHRTLIVANREAGLLYGAFALLRHLQTHEPLDGLNLISAPKIQRRLLNHWDDLNRHVERGYAGFSLWEWFYLPEIRDPRYRDYARALASLGLNGTVLTNVNANAQILTAPYLAKVAALAQEFRPWGVRIYLTARFSAPIEIGGLPTADPLDPAVAAWWQAKVAEIYRAIPDFGGFLVKANSEGQPGPQDYGRTHADGANMLADAVQPFNGIVMWRAFVYSPDNNDDRVKQAVSEFGPLDGKFRQNVIVQIKNGPLDFMPREPFSPLFGAMPNTRLAAELQITQEYLGQSIDLAYLAPLWKEVLDTDTYARREPVESANGKGTTIASIVDGSAKLQHPSVIAGVANTGTDRNWTGHLLAQSNWYAFGRLAWDHQLSSEQIADEWTRQTFGHDATVVATINKMLLGSRETVVNYSMPLGLTHIMAEGHHYGPGPWVDKLGRADWTSVYYHRADEKGLGFDRTATGSNALAQYAPEWQKLWGDPATCPENLLLWFHHVSWDHPMKSGRPLWDELCLRYQQGVDEVRTLQRDWASLQGKIDAERFTHVQQRLARQKKEAVNWRDACLLYFQQFSKRPFPAGVEPAAHPLEHYQQILRNMPGHR